MAYIAHENSIALLAVGGSVVNHRVTVVGGQRRTALVESTTGVTTAAAGAEVPASILKATAVSRGSMEVATICHWRTEATRCQSIKTNFKDATLPVITVELINGVAGINRRLKGNDTRALGAPGSMVGMHISTDDSTLMGYSKDPSQLTPPSD